MKRITYSCRCGEMIALEVKVGWREDAFLYGLVGFIRAGFEGQHEGAACQTNAREGDAEGESE